MILNHKIFADFHNADSSGRIRLTTAGTLEDIKRLNIELQNGLQVILNDHEEFETVGIIEYSENENIWVAKIDWNKITHF